MGKLTIIFYTFVIVVLSLFSTFVYLMTTVNPGHLTDLHAHGATTVVTTETVVVTTGTKTETTSKRAGLMKLLDYNEGEERTGDGRKTTNLTDSKKSKGRRSIYQRSKKKNPGVVIMKIVDSEGKPRLEIVFYPKRSNNDWKKYKKFNALGSKRPKTDLLDYSILNIMPDDSIVFENKDILYKRDLEPEFSITADISNKTEATEEDVKNRSPNLLKIPGHNERVIKLSTVLPSQPYPINDANITYKMEIDTNSKEKQIESCTDVLVENTLHSTSYLHTVSRNIADIGINKTEFGLGINIINPNEEVTERNIILRSPAQDTPIESLPANVTTEMTMTFSEELHTVSYEDVSTKNTYNLLHSTSLNFNTACWNKDIGIDQNESNTDIFDLEDQEIILTTTSDLNNESETKPNSFLKSAQDISATEGSHAKITIEMEMDFSKEVQTKSYTDISAKDTDHLFHSTTTSTNFSNFSFIKEDIEMNNNKSNTDVFETKHLGSILTTSNFSERATKSNTILMSPAQDTSPRESENITVKMEIDISEQLQTKLCQDVSIKDTDNFSRKENIITWTEAHTVITETNEDVSDMIDHELSLQETPNNNGSYLSELSTVSLSSNSSTQDTTPEGTHDNVSIQVQTDNSEKEQTNLT